MGMLRVLVHQQLNVGGRIYAAGQRAKLNDKDLSPGWLEHYKGMGFVSEDTGDAPEIDLDDDTDPNAGTEQAPQSTPAPGQESGSYGVLNEGRRQEGGGPEDPTSSSGGSTIDLDEDAGEADGSSNDTGTRPHRRHRR